MSDAVADIPWYTSSSNSEQAAVMPLAWKHSRPDLNYLRRMMAQILRNSTIRSVPFRGEVSRRMVTTSGGISRVWSSVLPLAFGGTSVGNIPTGMSS